MGTAAACEHAPRKAAATARTRSLTRTIIPQKPFRRNLAGTTPWVIGDEPVVVVDFYGASNYAKGA